jgi:ABC-type dipeptide/oligopeptide/nickel transport system ATPase component
LTKDPEYIFKIRNLSIHLKVKDQEQSILSSLDWEWERGKVYALIGESGSGKTTFGHSLFGILPGTSRLDYDEYSLLGRDWKAWSSLGWDHLRGKKVGLIPQNPHLAFHPYRKMGAQVSEFYKYTEKSMQSKDKIIKSWEEFGLRSPESAYNSFPRSLSGGEKQRICISMIHHSPAEIILADEPTTALDPIQEKNIMEYLLRSVKENNKTLVLITHDLKLMLRLADEVMVIKSGKLVEKNTKVLSEFSDWKSDYAKELLSGINR